MLTHTQRCVGDFDAVMILLFSARMSVMERLTNHAHVCEMEGTRDRGRYDTIEEFNVD